MGRPLVPKWQVKIRTTPHLTSGTEVNGSEKQDAQTASAPSSLSPPSSSNHYREVVIAFVACSFEVSDSAMRRISDCDETKRYAFMQYLCHIYATFLFLSRHTTQRNEHRVLSSLLSYVRSIKLLILYLNCGSDEQCSLSENVTPRYVGWYHVDSGGLQMSHRGAVRDHQCLIPYLFDQRSRAIKASHLPSSINSFL